MDVRDDVVEIIAGFSLFADLSTQELDRIVQLFDEAWFAEGEKVLRQGFTGSGFYVILDGSAVIRIDGVDRLDHRMMLRKPGAHVGAIGCSPTQCDAHLILQCCQNLRQAIIAGRVGDDAMQTRIGAEIATFCFERLGRLLGGHATTRQ